MPKPTAATSSASRSESHGLRDRRHERRLVERQRRPADAMAHGEIGPDDPREELGPAEVDPDHAARSRHRCCHHTPPRMSDEKPPYKVYRSRPKLLSRGEQPGLDELREPAAGRRSASARTTRSTAAAAAAAPEAARAAARRAGPRRARDRARPEPRRRITPGRVLRWVLLALVGWVALSAVLFMVSAQIQRGDLADAVGPQLATAPTRSRARTRSSCSAATRAARRRRSPAAEGAPSRSDSIMLLRIGGGANASLSIPRDTIVDIPGHGRNKINAAYAFGGPALATETVKAYHGPGDQPRRRGLVRQLPAADRRARRRHVQGRLRRVQDQRRQQERRLHAAVEEGRDGDRRGAGARPGAHAQERLRARARTTSTAPGASSSSWRR